MDATRSRRTRIGPGNPGMPATASGGSPGSWASAAGSKRRPEWTRYPGGWSPALEPTGARPRGMPGDPAKVLISPIGTCQMRLRFYTTGRCRRTKPCVRAGPQAGSLSPRTASPPGRRSTRPWVASGGRRSEADAPVVPRSRTGGRRTRRFGGEFPHIPRRRTRRYELGTKPGFSTLGGNSHDFPAGTAAVDSRESGPHAGDGPGHPSGGSSWRPSRTARCSRHPYRRERS